MVSEFRVCNIASNAVPLLQFFYLSFILVSTNGNDTRRLVNIFTHKIETRLLSY